MRPDDIYIMQGEWPAQDIVLPNGQVIRGHVAFGMQISLDVPIVTENPLRYVVYINPKEKETTE